MRVDQFHDPEKTRYTFSDIVGNSPSLVDLINRAQRVSPISSNVLIEGESGTGKELIAHSIHRNSQFAHGPFVAINCGAIPEALLESELFGYEKGAFTGTKKEGCKGKFELANGGTLFLDEIHYMSKTAQAKLLRVLEDRQLDRLGGGKSISINARVISASSVNLVDQMKRGHFIEALFFRINVVRLSVPALRDRREDIPLLVDHFIRQMNKKFGRAIRGIEPAVLQAFFQYSWPGNIRELKNVIECAVALCDRELITIKDVDDHLFSEDENGKNLSMNIHNVTKNFITDSLKQTKSIKKTAEKLDIPLSTLYRKMKKFNIPISSF